MGDPAEVHQALEEPFEAGGRAEVHPLTREIASTALQAIAALREVLVEGLGGGDQVRAAVELALGFHTWRSLVRHSRLSRDAAVELMATLVSAA